MFHHKFKNTLLAFALFGTATLGAETRQEVTAEALQKNPELHVLEQRIAAAKGRVTTARTYSNPELTVAPGVKHTNDMGRTANEFHGDFAVSQLFKFPGKRALGIAIEQRNVELTELAREAFRFQLTSKVRRAFYDFLAAEKIVASRRDQVTSAKMFVESAKKRAEAGYASDFETVKSQADLITATKALLQADGRVNAGRVTMNALMGRIPSAPLEITGEFSGVQPRGSQADFLALALARNPGIRTQTRQAEIAGLSLRATRFGRRPDFAVGPSLEYTRFEQIVGLSASFALPLWDQKKGELQTATAEQRKALAELEKTRADVSAEVTKAAANVELARAQLALYSPAFIERLKAVTSQAEQAYAQNTTTLIIYLDAKRTYFDTLAEYYDALGNVAQSRADLESAVGVPLELNP